MCPEKAKILVAEDGRSHDPACLDMLSTGLAQAGASVVTLGQLPTPMVYYACERVKADAVAMVTGGNLPASYTGLKWMLGRKPPTLEQISILANETRAFFGEKPVSRNSKGFQFGLPLIPSARLSGGIRQISASVTEPRSLDVTFDYVAHQQDIWFDSPKRSMHVVIDPMYGAWSFRARRYLQAIFPHIVFSSIRDQQDEMFGDVHPDLTERENFAALSRYVDTNRADFGVMLDGDGCRSAFVDDLGVPLKPDELSWLLLHYFQGLVDENDVIPIDTLSSRHVRKKILDMKAKPLETGNSYADFLRVMEETNAPIGINSNGSCFCRANTGHADPLFLTCHLIHYLSTVATPLSKIRKIIPPMEITHFIPLEVTTTESEELFQKLTGVFQDRLKLTLNGVRLDLEQGEVMIRDSGVDSRLIFRFEAANYQDLELLVKKITTFLGPHRQKLLANYVKSI